MSKPNSTSIPVLFDKPECPFCWRVRLFMRLLNYPCSFKFVDTNNKPQSLLDVNPEGTVPVLVGQTVICGSGNIIDFLVSNYPDWELSEQGRILCEYADNTLGRNTRNWIFIKRDNRQFENTDSELAKSLEQWHNCLTFLEQQIHQGDWFLGDKPSLVDCFLLPRLALPMKYDMPAFHEHEKLWAWFDKIQQSDLYTQTAPP